MGNLTGRMPTQTIDKREHDSVEGRRRIATHVDGNGVTYEDSNFTSGESPAVLAVATDLGRTGHEGYFRNDGPGDITIEISFDGTTYGSSTTVRGGETFSLKDLKINRIRLTYVDPSEYRVFVA